MPEKWEQRFKPYVFIGPAVFVVGAFLLYPAIQTFIDSFRGPSADEFVGLENYQFLVTDPAVREAMFNNLLWIVFVPTAAVAVGLAIAVLADRLQPRWENVAKSTIFLPMAISFVGASTIWGFMYAWRPQGRPQIGLLNSIVTGFGFTPVTWLQTTPINDFALMFIMVWLQAGFAMVLLSAAIKAVPEDTIEAARIDGATETQIFWRVVVPQIASTIAVVTTTILILVLKVFDIVRVLTGGRFGTDIIANLFITELITFRQFGHAAVIVVALILATIPVMIWNIRRFREQEATR
ncbi:MAG: sugar ABC transporter permease [Actinobacteria bacterium]|nr:sugar ABC transporter permease [Actinomycetota bacterium]